MMTEMTGNVGTKTKCIMTREEALVHGARRSYAYMLLLDWTEKMGAFRNEYEMSYPPIFPKTKENQAALEAVRRLDEDLVRLYKQCGWLVQVTAQRLGAQVEVKGDSVVFEKENGHESYYSFTWREMTILGHEEFGGDKDYMESLDEIWRGSFDQRFKELRTLYSETLRVMEQILGWDYVLGQNEFYILYTPEMLKEQPKRLFTHERGLTRSCLWLLMCRLVGECR